MQVKSLALRLRFCVKIVNSNIFTKSNTDKFDLHFIGFRLSGENEQKNDRMNDETQPKPKTNFFEFKFN